MPVPFVALLYSLPIPLGLSLLFNYAIITIVTFFREIPDCPAVWANEETLEKCRDVLREVLEEWLILKLRDGDQIPSIERIDLNAAG